MTEDISAGEAVKQGLSIAAKAIFWIFVFCSLSFGFCCLYTKNIDSPSGEQVVLILVLLTLGLNWHQESLRSRRIMIGLVLLYILLHTSALVIGVARHHVSDNLIWGAVYAVAAGAALLIARVVGGRDRGTEDSTDGG